MDNTQFRYNSRGYTSDLYRITNAIKTNTTVDRFKEIIPDDFDIKSGGRCGWNCLGIAAEKGNVELVKYILETYGKDIIDLGNEFGMTPLYCAAENRGTINVDKRIEVAKILLDNGADINAGMTCSCSDSDYGDLREGDTPLFAAIRSRKNEIEKNLKGNNMPMIEFLISRGAERTTSKVTKKVVYA